MGFEVRHNCHDERSRGAFCDGFRPSMAASPGIVGASLAKGSERQIMRAQDNVRPDLLEVPIEARAGGAWEEALHSAKPARKFWIVSSLEEHAPKFRRMLDQFDIAIGVDFAL